MTFVHIYIELEWFISLFFNLPKNIYMKICLSLNTGSLEEMLKFEFFYETKTITEEDKNRFFKSNQMSESFLQPCLALCVPVMIMCREEM